ncbi:MAG: hypothetical protein Q8K36_03925 [Alphaproteobacteria bacterium]|nr:hypothetical protein [Alphaproteobacteria bacterium]
MLSSQVKAHKQVYPAARQSVKSDLMSIRTFCGAYFLFFSFTLCLFLILNGLLHYYGLTHYLGPITLEILHPVTSALILSSLSGTIVLMQSPVICPVHFNFPMIKAYRNK